MKKLFVALSSWVFLNACATFPKNLEQPQVQLQQVDVAPSDFSNLNLVFNFLVQNPNSVPIQVDRLDYRLQINGKPFTQGVLDQGLKVGARSSAVIPLPIAVKSTDLVSSISDFLQAGRSNYQITGSVKSGFFSIPFHQNGEIHLSDLSK